MTFLTSRITIYVRINTRHWPRLRLRGRLFVQLHAASDNRGGEGNKDLE